MLKKCEVLEQNTTYSTLLTEIFLFFNCNYPSKVAICGTCAIILQIFWRSFQGVLHLDATSKTSRVCFPFQSGMATHPKVHVPL